MTNAVVLIGRLGRPPERRELPTGQQLVAYELVIDRPGAPVEQIPVVWVDAPAGVPDFGADKRVLVVGRVRRRFFRADGGTQSRTEVVADEVVDSQDIERANAAMRRVQDLLAEASLSG